MPLQPSPVMRFDSWENLLRWLPEANESQLMTVFVWAGDLESTPSGDLAQLGKVRKEAFELLVRRTRDRLRRYLLTQAGCRDEHLAEDVVQQALIKVYLRAEQFDPCRSLWGWLFRITHNEYIDCLRRQRPGDLGIGQQGAPEEEAEHWLDRATGGPAPDASMIALEHQRQLEGAIAALPRLQRSVVQLRGEGVKGIDIAERLGISQAYVSQLFKEAGAALREAVGS